MSALETITQIQEDLSSIYDVPIKDLDVWVDTFSKSLDELKKEIEEE